MSKIRIGNGIDFHKLVEDEFRPFVLGGYHFESGFALLGHSDADILLHSIADAILGSLALGDIGEYYPDHDPALKNMKSTIIIDKVLSLIHEKGYELSNVDATIVAEFPKISPIKQKIRDSLSHILKIPVDCISIKATTMEGMGALGRAEGMMVFSTVLVSSKV
jgi:2-C-methyl-D-erythritol 2,4-cyclodiphosphate synthase